MKSKMVTQYFSHSSAELRPQYTCLFTFGNIFNLDGNTNKGYNFALSTITTLSTLLYNFLSMSLLHTLDFNAS